MSPTVSPDYRMLPFKCGHDQSMDSDAEISSQDHYFNVETRYQEIIIMNIKAIIYATIVTASLGYMSTAIADDMVVLPDVKTQNGIAYLSGGIGSDQVSAMKSAAKDYAFMLTCSVQNTGEYLADVKVSITDKAGTVVLDTVTEGPILLAKLSPGQYRISADSNGTVLKKTVQIGAGHPVKLNLYWPAQPSNEQ